jgi:hypothetical protein
MNTTSLSQYARHYIQTIQVISKDAQEHVDEKGKATETELERNQAYFNRLVTLAYESDIYHNYHRLDRIVIPKSQIEAHLFGHTMTEFTKQIHDKRFEYEKRRPQCDPVDTAMLEDLVLCHVRARRGIRDLEPEQLETLHKEYSGILNSVRDAQGDPLTSCAQILLKAEWQAAYFVMCEEATYSSIHDFRKALLKELRMKAVLAKNDFVRLDGTAFCIHLFITLSLSPEELKEDIPSFELLGAYVHHFFNAGLWKRKALVKGSVSAIEPVVRDLYNLVVKNKADTVSPEEPTLGELSGDKTFAARFYAYCREGIANVAILMSIKDPDGELIGELYLIYQTVKAWKIE